MRKIRINIVETASFDVDPQKGFTPLCPNELPVAGGDEIVYELNHQADYANFRVASKDWHPPNARWIANEEHPQFSPVGLPQSDIYWNAHCIAGTRGAEFLDGLPPTLNYSFVAYKGMEPAIHPYGACYHDLSQTQSTGIIQYLSARKIKRVLIGGLATDYCVKMTALQLRHYFKVVVNLAACRGVARDTTDAAIGEMLREGIKVINDLDELEFIL